jgi:hypothetical protein
MTTRTILTPTGDSFPWSSKTLIFLLQKSFVGGQPLRKEKTSERKDRFTKWKIKRKKHSKKNIEFELFIYSPWARENPGFPSKRYKFSILMKSNPALAIRSNKETI